MVSVSITFDQLVAAVQQLQPNERTRLAQVLIRTDLQTDLARLLREIYDEPPVDDITDADIAAEVRAVQQGSH
ncbi:MAG: hypothetical protein AAF716_08505 [Cyanobacteria bacterium P01_D01_bin.1]